MINEIGVLVFHLGLLEKNLELLGRRSDLGLAADPNTFVQGQGVASYNGRQFMQYKNGTGVYNANGTFKNWMDQDQDECSQWDYNEYNTSGGYRTVFPGVNGRYFFGRLQTGGYIGNWKMMECVLGFVGGGFIAGGFAAVRGMLGSLSAAPAAMSGTVSLIVSCRLAWANSRAV